MWLKGQDVLKNPFVGILNSFQDNSDFAEYDLWIGPVVM